MNKTKSIYTLSIIAVIFALTPYLMGSSTLEEHNDSHKEKSSTPNVPKEITFAGERITFDRYDKREKMDRELISFCFMHTNSHLIIKRANRYFPVIEPILKENNIPDDLKYLMVIESSMNPFARSVAGAAGFWQFMPATGREYGLEVNKNIDERYHIEKSTVAACKYLKDAYAKFGDWISATASYNAGQARIATELQKQGVKDASELWLVEETSRYIYRILAAKLFFQNPQQFGFHIKKEQLYPPLEYNEYTTTTGIANLSTFAKQQGVTLALLKDFNPWLRETSLENRSGRTYKLKIPNQKGLSYNPKDIVPYNKNWVIH